MSEETAVGGGAVGAGAGGGDSVSRADGARGADLAGGARGAGGAGRADGADDVSRADASRTGADDASAASPVPTRRVAGSRRAQRPAPAGVDPRPADHSLTSRATEDKPEGWGETSPRRAHGAGENDERLKVDKPPHWG